MTTMLDTEEHLLRTLDADPGDRAALAALADLCRERGEESAADWLAWALRTGRVPDAEDKFYWAKGWYGPHYYDDMHPRVRRAKLPPQIWVKAANLTAGLLAHWRLFLAIARRTPFNLTDCDARLESP